MSQPQRVLLLTLAILLAGFGCSLRKQLNAQALNPFPHFEIIPDDFALTPETLWVPVDGASIHAWVFAPDNPIGTLVICNGNTGNKALFLPAVPQFTAAGYEVVLFDYRGFGLSTGEADFFTMVDDVAQVIDAVRARNGGRPLGILGTSLGSAVATLVARERPDAVQALVLESVFSPREGCRRAVGKLLGPLACTALIPRRFAIRRQLPRITQPTLMLHGERDTFTPLDSAARIYRRAAQKGVDLEFWLAADAGHTPGLVGAYGPIYTRRIREFFNTHLARRGSPRSFVHASPPDKGRGFETRFAPDMVHHGARTPVEIAMVYASGKAGVQQTWLEPGELSISQEAAEPVLVVGARVVRDPVEPEGEGWTAIELRTRRRIAGLEKQQQELLGSKYSPMTLLRLGVPQFAPGKRVQWKPFVLEPEEQPGQRAASLIDLKTAVRAAADAAETEEDRARAVGLLAQVGAALELVNREDLANEAYVEALERLPAQPHAVILYGDGRWTTGMSGTVGPVLIRLIELANTSDERRRWLLRLGEFEHAQSTRWERLQRWRTDQAE